MTAPDRIAQTLIKNSCQPGASTYDKASDVEDLLVERGIMVSYETIRRAPELNICED
jgi:hypothetical protein